MPPRHTTNPVCVSGWDGIILAGPRPIEHYPRAKDKGSGAEFKAFGMFPWDQDSIFLTLFGIAWTPGHSVPSRATVTFQTPASQDKATYFAWRRYPTYVVV